MAEKDNFEYISHASLVYKDGYRNAYLGEVKEPVVRVSRYFFFLRI